jgi:hypothetical protein
MRLTLIGLSIGLAGTFAATRVLSSMLYGVGTYDPVTIAVVAVVLSAVAGLACFLPAWRITKADPIETQPPSSFLTRRKRHASFSVALSTLPLRQQMLSLGNACHALPSCTVVRRTRPDVPEARSGWQASRQMLSLKH